MSATTERRYISVADTAKLVRTALKAQFPAVKFSVKSKSYAGGASIDISWTDGPTTKMVDRMVGKYAGASFDGMIDLKSYHDSDLNGERVHFGADYVFTHRTLTKDTMTQVLAEAKRRYGIEATITSYGGFDVVGNNYSDEHWVNELVSRAYCDDAGRVVDYVEVK